MLPSTALPSAWIDRLFQRFSVMYGKHWADQWEGVPMADVKDAWATELAGVAAERIGVALKGCGTFPPTLPEFVALCKPPALPAAHRLLPSPQLEQSKREIPAVIKAELDRLMERMRVTP